MFAEKGHCAPICMSLQRLQLPLHLYHYNLHPVAQGTLKIQTMQIMSQVLEDCQEDLEEGEAL